MVYCGQSRQICNPWPLPRATYIQHSFAFSEAMCVRHTSMLVNNPGYLCMLLHTSTMATCLMMQLGSTWRSSESNQRRSTPRYQTRTITACCDQLTPPAWGQHCTGDDGFRYDSRMSLVSGCGASLVSVHNSRAHCFELRAG